MPPRQHSGEPPPSFSRPPGPSSAHDTETAAVLVKRYPYIFKYKFKYKFNWTCRRSATKVGGYGAGTARHGFGIRPETVLRWDLPRAVTAAAAGRLRSDPAPRRRGDRRHGQSARQGLALGGWVLQAAVDLVCVHGLPPRDLLRRAGQDRRHGQLGVFSAGGHGARRPSFTRRCDRWRAQKGLSWAGHRRARSVLKEDRG